MTPRLLNQGAVRLLYLLGGLAFGTGKLDAQPQPQPQRDFCQYETFNASCAQASDVILMTSARYGRMREGRCALREYGQIGCAADVLAWTDARCSGRGVCRVPVSEVAVEGGVRPCSDYLTAYLEAAYQCVTVAQHQCRIADSARVLIQSDYYLSPSRPPYSPSAPCRLLLHTTPGRQLNLTLYNFATTAAARRLVSAAPGGAEACRALAVVREPSAESGERPVCAGGVERVTHVMMTATNEVEVEWKERRIGGEETPPRQHFLIHFQAVGCETPAYPAASYSVNRSVDALVVECRGSAVQTRALLRCVDSHWLGSDVINCSTALKDAQEHTSVWSIFGSEGWSTSYGMAMVVALGVLSGFIIGAILLIVTICFVHWRQRRGETARNVPPVTPHETRPSPSHHTDTNHVYHCATYATTTYPPVEKYTTDPDAWTPGLEPLPGGLDKTRTATLNFFQDCPWQGASVRQTVLGGSVDYMGGCGVCGNHVGGRVCCANIEKEYEYARDVNPHSHNAVH